MLNIILSLQFADTIILNISAHIVRGVHGYITPSSLEVAYALKKIWITF